MANGTTGLFVATFNNFAFDSSWHQQWVGQHYTTNAQAARMIQVDSYFAAASGGGLGGAVAWLNDTYASGAGLYTAQTIAAGAFNSSGGTTYASTGDIPTLGTDQWAFGSYCANGVYCYWKNSQTPSGVMKAAGITDLTGGTTIGTHFSTTDGAISAFGTYFILQLFVHRGGVWVSALWDLKRGGVQTIPHVKLRRSGVWVTVDERASQIPFDPIHSHPVMIREEDTGVWESGIARWEGPYYTGSPNAREYMLYGFPDPRGNAYEIVTPKELVAV